MEAVTLEDFTKELSEFKQDNKTDTYLSYWAQEGEPDWDGAEYHIGYATVDERNLVYFDDDETEAPPGKKEGDVVLCYSYNRNYSEEEGVFAIAVIEDWTAEELYITLTQYGKLFKF